MNIPRVWPQSLNRLCCLLIAALLSGCYILDEPVITAENAVFLPDLPGHYEISEAGKVEATLDLAALDGGPAYRFDFLEQGEAETGTLLLTPARDGVFLAQIDVKDEGRFLYFCRIEEGRITMMSSAFEEADEKALAQSHGIELVKRELYNPFIPVGEPAKILAFLNAVSAGPLEILDGDMVKAAP